MKYNFNSFIICLITIIGSLSVNGQTTIYGTNLLEDKDLDSATYFYNSKTDYLIHKAYKVNYDVFMVHYFSPIQLDNNAFYQTLSTPGSSTKNLIFDLDNIFDYRLQTNNFLPYWFSNNKTKLFQVPTAYTGFEYCGSSNGNQYFNIVFSKNLYKGLNLQTQYFVNYADGDFTNSQVMNQFFNFSLNYISPSGRYHNDLIFSHNRVYTLENGGIESDSLFENNLYQHLDSYPVNSQSAWQKIKSSQYSFNQSFRLDTDTTKQNIINLGAITHSIGFLRQARLYNDPLQVAKDSIGENVFTNSLFWTNDIYGNNNNFFIPISLGVNIDNLNFNDSLSSNNFLLYSPEIIFGIRANKFTATMQASKIFSSTDYNGDYQLKILLKEKLSNKKNNYIFASYNLVNRTNDYVYTHYLSYQNSWDNDFVKQKSANITLGISFEDQLIIELKYFDINDYIHFDNNLNISSYDTKLWQLGLKNDFTLNNWRFRGMYYLQNVTNGNALHLPVFVFKQGLGYSFNMFAKKLKAIAGCDINYSTSYFADSYNSPTNMFVWQEDKQYGNYLYFDAFFNINIQRFCLFVIVQHPYAGMINHKYFSTPLYPNEGFVIRYGISWKFLD